jgi:hypothetical protein
MTSGEELQYEHFDCLSDRVNVFEAIDTGLPDVHMQQITVLLP